jgi:hypothetical protein
MVRNILNIMQREITSTSQLPQKWLNEYEKILYTSSFPGCKSHKEREEVAFREVMRLYLKEVAKIEALKQPDLFDANGSFNPENRRKRKKDRA